MNWRLEKRPPLANVVGPLSHTDHRSTSRGAAPLQLPVADTPFVEHVRVPATEADWPATASGTVAPADVDGKAAVANAVDAKECRWVGTIDGLYSNDGSGWTRYPTYGVDGPPSNVIADLALDSHGTLWVATPAGLAARDANGSWRIIRGREGLPWEQLTSIALTKNDELWLGSTRGLVFYKPYAEGRQWVLPLRRALPPRRPCVRRSRIGRRQERLREDGQGDWAHRRGRAHPLRESGGPRTAP